MEVCHEEQISIHQDDIDAFEQIKPYMHPKDVACDALSGVDTTINQFHLRYKWMPNEDIIQRNYTDTVIKYADNSLYIDVDYGGRKIITAKEIRKNGLGELTNLFQPLSDYQLYGVSIEHATDSTLTLQFGIYMPDTDVGDSIELNITRDGETTFSLVPYISDSEDD